MQNYKRTELNPIILVGEGNDIDDNDYNYGGSLEISEDEKLMYALLSSLSYDSDPDILHEYNLDVDLDLTDYQSMVLYDHMNVYYSIRGSKDFEDFAISDVAIFLGKLKNTPRYKKEKDKFLRVVQKYSKRYINLCGHSLGGSICLNLTYQFPTLVNECVVFNPGFSYPDIRTSLYKRIQSTLLPDFLKSNAVKAYDTKIKIYHQKYDPVSLLAMFDKNTERQDTDIVNHVHSIDNFTGGNLDISDDDYRKKMLMLIQQYQPDIFLSNREKYLPCSFDFLFANMKLDGTRMVLKEPLKKANERREWFKGDINNAQIYVFSSIVGNELTLRYYLLFAYNLGKYVLALNKEIGNHVSDLEHCSLTFDISGDKITPLRFSNMYHHTREENNWDGRKLTFYCALGSHGFYRTKDKQFYNNNLKMLNIYDDTTDCNRLFNPNKYIVYDSSNYRGENDFAFDENGKDVSLAIPEYNIKNWINEVTGFGNVDKVGVIKIPFTKTQIAENTGSIKNPSVDFKNL